MGVTYQQEQSLTTDNLSISLSPPPLNFPNLQQYCSFYLDIYHNTELVLMLLELSFHTCLQNHTVERTGSIQSARVTGKQFPVIGPAICLWGFFYTRAWLNRF